MPSRIAFPQPRAARLPRLPHVSWRIVAGTLAVAGLLAGGWLWLRDSSLVQVDRVKVTGAHGFGSAAVRSALDAAARDMTTLNVDERALRSAVERYPLVRDVRASAQPPHGITIRVIERVPLGVIRASGAPVVVTDDGILLRNVPVGDLPEISARVPPGGSRVRDRKTAAKVAVLVDAPARLRSRVTRVSLGRYGLQARLRDGPLLRFGDGSRLRAKWIAAERVLRDPAAAGATYVDLRVPSRPAAGGLTELQGGAPSSLTAVAEDPAAIAAGTTPGPAAATPPAPTSDHTAPAVP